MYVLAATVLVNQARVSTVQIVTIVISVVLTLGLITCIISHYKMGARSWSERRNRQSPQPSGRQQQQLQPPSCPQQYQQQHYTQALAHQSSSMLYSPASVKERQRLESEAHHDHQVRMQSVQTDMGLELPPSIALPDGEGPPYSSLKNLKLRDPEQESEIYRGCIRPPPNRTIIEGDALPPFRSNSVSLIHKSSPPTGLVQAIDGAPLVMRSHSMSSSRAQSSSRLSYPHSQFSTIQPPLRIQPPLLVGRTTTTSPSSSSKSKNNRQTCECDRPAGEEFGHTDPPPRYSDVVISWDFGTVLNSQPHEGV